METHSLNSSGSQQSKLGIGRVTVLLKVLGEDPSYRLGF
jgi:hypothetical protein